MSFLFCGAQKDILKNAGVQTTLEPRQISFYGQNRNKKRWDVFQYIKKKSYRFGTKYGWVNYDRMLFFVWTIPLKINTGESIRKLL